MKNEKTTTIFSNRLKIIRKQAKLTWRELANNIEISEATLYNYIDGSSPSSDILLKIADYFNVTTDWLLGRTDDPQPAPSSDPAPPALSPEEHLDRAVSVYFGDDLPEDKKEDILVELKSNLIRLRKELKNERLWEQIANSARAAPESSTSDASGNSLKSEVG